MNEFKSIEELIWDPIDYGLFYAVIDLESINGKIYLKITDKVDDIVDEKLLNILTKIKKLS